MEIGAGDLEQMVTEHKKELTHLIKSRGDVDENPSKLPFFTDEIAKNGCESEGLFMQC